MASAASASAVKKHHSLESCIVDSQQLAQNIIHEIDAILPTLKDNTRNYIKYEGLRNAIGFMQDTRRNLYNRYLHESEFRAPDPDSTLDLCSAYNEVLSYVHANLSDITKLTQFLGTKSGSSTSKKGIYYQTLFWIYDDEFGKSETRQLARKRSKGGKKRSHRKKGGKKSHRKRSHRRRH
jgi:hypothetical protein